MGLRDLCMKLLMIKTRSDYHAFSRGKNSGSWGRINVRHDHSVGKEIFLGSNRVNQVTGQSKNINFTIIYKILLLKLAIYAKNTGSSSRENTSNINVNNNALKFKK